MHLNEATVEQLQAEIERRETEVPDGYRLVSTAAMQTGKWDLYNAHPQVDDSWILASDVTPSQRLKFLNGHWPILVVARKASDG